MARGQMLHHLCPGCQSAVLWALTYCTQCNWRTKHGPPGEKTRIYRNPPWIAFLEGDVRDRSTRPRR